MGPQCGTCFVSFGACNFEMTPRYLENFCTPVLCYINLADTYSVYKVLQILSQQRDNFNNEKSLFNSTTKLHFLPFVIVFFTVMNSMEFKNSTETS
jgi:hypothetical protein